MGRGTVRLPRSVALRQALLVAGALHEHSSESDYLALTRPKVQITLPADSPGADGVVVDVDLQGILQRSLVTCRTADGDAQVRQTQEALYLRLYPLT